MGYFGEQNSLHPSSLPSKLRCLPFPTCSSNIEWWGGGGKLHFSPLKSAKFSKRPFSRADCFNPGVLTDLWVIDSGKAWGLEHNHLDVLLYSNSLKFHAMYLNFCCCSKVYFFWRCTLEHTKCQIKSFFFPEMHNLLLFPYVYHHMFAFFCHYKPTHLPILHHPPFSPNTTAHTDIILSISGLVAVSPAKV